MGANSREEIFVPVLQAVDVVFDVVHSLLCVHYEEVKMTDEVIKQILSNVEKILRSSDDSRFRWLCPPVKTGVDAHGWQTYEAGKTNIILIAAGPRLREVEDYLEAVARNY
jgi:hypothetical protein